MRKIIMSHNKKKRVRPTFAQLQALYNAIQKTENKLARISKAKKTRQEKQRQILGRLRAKSEEIKLKRKKLSELDNRRRFAFYSHLVKKGLSRAFVYETIKYLALNKNKNKYLPNEKALCGKNIDEAINILTIVSEGNNENMSSQVLREIRQATSQFDLTRKRK